MWGKIYRRLQSEIHYFRFVYWSESRLLWALAIFVLGLALGSSTSPLSLAVTVISTSSGAAALAIGIVQTLRKWRHITFVPRSSTSQSPELKAQWHSEKPCLVSTVMPGVQSTGIWFDELVNDALVKCVDVAGVFSTHSYELPARLRKIAALSLRSRNSLSQEGVTRQAPRPIRFNGQLIRLSSEPTVEQINGGELVFEPVSYFDGECSNELWSLADKQKSTVGLIDEHVVTRDGKIRPLEHSQVANITGISIFATTCDDQVIFIRQSKRNSIAPGALASSGSGSLGIGDLDSFGGLGAGSFSARDLIIEGMLRELREESLVHDDEIDRASAKITGYFRWANRGFKPEFTGLVNLSVTSQDLLARKHSGEESAFTQQLLFIPAQVLRDAGKAWAAARTQSPSQRWRATVSPLTQALESEADLGISPSGESAWVFGASSLS